MFQANSVNGHELDILPLALLFHYLILEVFWCFDINIDVCRCFEQYN